MLMQCRKNGLTNWFLKMYDLSYKLWENRNSILHAKVEANLNEKESAKLAQSIQSEYDKGPRDLGPADKVEWKLIYMS